MERTTLASATRKRQTVRAVRHDHRTPSARPGSPASRSIVSPIPGRVGSPARLRKKFPSETKGLGELSSPSGDVVRAQLRARFRARRNFRPEVKRVVEQGNSPGGGRFAPRTPVRFAVADSDRKLLKSSYRGAGRRLLVLEEVLA